MQNLLNDLLWILYPKLCASCGNALSKGENEICTHCRFHLPRTNHLADSSNLVVKRFWGRTHVEAATSFLHYDKGENVQHLIYALKYHGRKEVGIALGKMFGNELREIETFKADLIIPVPLHKKKKYKRGYNQSEFFATGLSQTMHIPCDFNALVRETFTDSQTRKTRYNRSENVEKVFRLVNHDAVRGRHILLVDDVVTTGSTLAACAEELLKAEGTKVSIATIASA